MNATELGAFKGTIRVSRLWLKEMMTEMGWDDEHKAYLAFRAVLHLIRDRLSIDEAAQFGSQLPMLVRGFYYENWRPSDAAHRIQTKEEFLERLGTYFAHEAVDPEQIVRAVFKVLADRITEDEMESIWRILPADVRGFWPRLPATSAA